MSYILQKGGVLVEEVWNPDTENYDLKDVTSKAIRLFAEPCRLDEGVTLKDLFLLLKTELELFDAFYGNWLKDIVEEGLQPHPEAYTGQYDPDGIEFVNLYWHVSKQDDELYGFNRPQCDGLGFELKEDLYHDWEPKTVMYSKGSRINWSISGTPSNKLINLPIRLDNSFNIYNEELDDPTNKYGELLHSLPNPSYTLGHIIDGIIWELSFHGGPTKRDQFNDKMKGILEDFKNNLDSDDK